MWVDLKAGKSIKWLDRFQVRKEAPKNKWMLGVAVEGGGWGRILSLKFWVQRSRRDITNLGPSTWRVQKPQILFASGGYHGRGYAEPGWEAQSAFKDKDPLKARNFVFRVFLADWGEARGTPPRIAVFSHDISTPPQLAKSLRALPSYIGNFYLAIIGNFYLKLPLFFCRQTPGTAPGRQGNYLRDRRAGRPAAAQRLCQGPPPSSHFSLQAARMPWRPRPTTLRSWRKGNPPTKRETLKYN